MIRVGSLKSLPISVRPAGREPWGIPCALAVLKAIILGFLGKKSELVFDADVYRPETRSNQVHKHFEVMVRVPFTNRTPPPLFLARLSMMFDFVIVFAPLPAR